MKDSTLAGHKQNLACTKTQRKGAVTTQKTEPKLRATVGGSPVGVGWQRLTTGRGALAAAVLEGPPWHKPSWRSPLTLGSVQSFSHVRLFATPWTAARQASLSITNSQSLLKLMSIESILRKINPEYLLEGLMLKLNLQYLGHLMQRADSLQKTLVLGKIEGRRRRGRQRMKWPDGITYSLDRSLNKLWEIMKDRMPGILQSTGSQRVRHNLVTKQQQQELSDIVNVLFLELSSDKLHECSLYNYLLIHLMHISICILYFTL